MCSQSLIHRPGIPAIQHGRTPTLRDGISQAVRIKVHNSAARRTVPTELFVTSISLSRMAKKLSASVAQPAAAVATETVDYGTTKIDQDGRLGLFGGFFWASTAAQADAFWEREYQPPHGYQIGARDTVMVPRRLLEASQTLQRIGRSGVFLPVYALSHFHLNGRRHHVQASYIRAQTPEMAIRLWQASERLNDSGLFAAMLIPAYWVRGVLDSPPIAKELQQVFSYVNTPQRISR